MDVIASMVDGIHDSDSAAQPAVEQVHFCRKFIRPSKPCEIPDVLSGKKPSLRTTGILCRVIPAVVLGGGGSYWLYTQRHESPWPTLVAALFVIVFYVYFLFGHRNFARKLKQDDIPTLPPVGARLFCVGAASDFPPLTYSDGVMFEPRVYRVPHTAKATGVQTALIFAAVAGMMLSAFLEWKSLQYISILTVLVTTAFMWLRPIYFRISPGRLEVLRYGFIRRIPIKVEEYDLRREYVVAHSKLGNLALSRSERKWRDFPLLLMSKRSEFLHTLFAAALSRQQAPALPRDTL